MTVYTFGAKDMLKYLREQRHNSDFGNIPNRLRKPQVADDPDPSIIAQLIETGRAEVTHGG